MSDQAKNPATSERPATAIPAAGDSWRTVPDLEQARQQINRSPFLIRHGLPGNPLFGLDALIEVAREAAKRPGDLYLDAGTVNVDDKWGHIPVPELPVDEIIRRIETAGAWIIMKHIERTPGYREVLQEFDDFVRSTAGPRVAGTLSNPEMLVIITSPGRVTPFHFDAETNFLVQVQGEKDAWIWQPDDRTAVTEQEIERYYSVNHNAGTYKQGIDERARKFHLNPGDAVHIPTHSAHWVKNGNGISVSLSLNYELPPTQYLNIYRANHIMRRVGLKPSPPGRHLLADGVKNGVFSLGRSLKKLRRG